MTLSTGSIVGVLGAPQQAESRYWDSPNNSIPRADAWYWTCGCSAEPVGPGRFTVVACVEHEERLQRRFEHKSRLSSRSYGASLPRIVPG